jgi:hypothetical protein
MVDAGLLVTGVLAMEVGSVLLQLCGALVSHGLAEVRVAGAVVWGLCRFHFRLLLPCQRGRLPRPCVLCSRLARGRTLVVDGGITIAHVGAPTHLAMIRCR